MGLKPKEITATHITLSDGSKIEADLVIMGYGTTPNTEFLGDIVEKDKQGKLVLDPFL
jgi:NADPH-dependent 2,4-dienoyl-CoA reductase/sulfur reductase-like enzyme